MTECEFRARRSSEGLSMKDSGDTSREDDMLFSSSPPRDGVYSQNLV